MTKSVKYLYQAVRGISASDISNAPWLRVWSESISISFSFSVSKPVQTKSNDASIVSTEEMSREEQGSPKESNKLQPANLRTLQWLLLVSLFFLLAFIFSSVHEENTAKMLKSK